LSGTSLSATCRPLAADRKDFPLAIPDTTATFLAHSHPLRVALTVNARVIRSGVAGAAIRRIVASGSSEETVRHTDAIKQKREWPMTCARLGN
jgi:hypothetical protein